jgi:superfamily II DNA or RNA helicase
MHSNNKKIKLKLKSNNNNFIDYKNTKEKGDIYEKYIYYHLLETNKFKNVWLWKNVPEYDLLKSGIMDNWNNARLIRKKDNIDSIYSLDSLDNRLPDFATDLFTLEKDDHNNDKYSIIQCKNYDDSRKLRPEHLGTFYFMMYRYSNFVNGMVFHTNDLCENLLNHSNTNDNIKYNRVTIEEDKYKLYHLDKDDDNTDVNSIDNNNIILDPFQYQIDAYEALKGKHRTVLQMACGTGKTLVSILLAKDYKQNIIVSPLKAYCEQNMERFQSQMSNEYKMLIIDSDNDGRNNDKIKEFIKNNEKICLFVTYKSIDIINELISNKLFNEYFIIIDEFHNISYRDVYQDDYELEDVSDDDLEDDVFDESDEDISEDDENEISERDVMDTETSQMYNLLHSDSKIIFMSATPKLFDIDLDSPDDNEIDNDIFGNIDYTYSMSSAIDEGRICDYKIFVPTLHIAKDTGIDLIYNEANLKDYNKELVIKARYVIKGMMELGSRKCIIYLQSQSECREMTTIIKEQCKNYFAISHNCNYIISNDLKKERKEKLKSFIHFDGYSFLCSVDILNECIDIPKCDSIFIAYPSKSKIRNIQRLCRANRKDKENPNKIANIFLWCDDYKDDLVDFISHIKEYDSNFTFNKINRLNVSNESKTLMMPEIEADENKELENIVVGFRSVDGWMEKYNEVINFFEKEKKRPRSDLIDKNQKQLSAWLRNNMRYYNRKINATFNKYKILWEGLIEKYECYFPNLKLEEKWFIMFDKVNNYISITGKKPYNKNDNNIEEKEYGLWLSKELQSFKNKKHLMKNDKIYKTFNDFVIKNKNLLKNNEDKWIAQQILIIDFIKTHKILPKTHLCKEQAHLADWLRIQKKHYKNNTGSFIYPKVKELWNQLLVDYPIILNTNKGWVEEWIEKMNKLQEFININKRMPELKSKNIIIKQLSSWYYGQKNNYNKNKQLLNNDHITKLWEEFIEKNKIYFPIDDNEIWMKNYNDVILFITKYSKRPSKGSKDETENKLGCWMSNQLGFYKNNTFQFKNLDLTEKFKNMILKYPHLFEKIDKDEYNVKNWFENFKLVNDYISLNNKRPLGLKNSSDVDLNSWLLHQIGNMKNKENMLSRDNIYLAFNEFYLKYRNTLFETLEEQWINKLNNLKIYIDNTKQKPSKENKNKDIKILGMWLAAQKSNYKEKIGTVSNNLEIKNIYEKFLKDYEKYL